MANCQTSSSMCVGRRFAPEGECVQPRNLSEFGSEEGSLQDIERV